MQMSKKIKIQYTLTTLTKNGLILVKGWSFDYALFGEDLMAKLFMNEKAYAYTRHEGCNIKFNDQSMSIGKCGFLEHDHLNQHKHCSCCSIKIVHTG